MDEVYTHSIKRESRSGPLGSNSADCPIPFLYLPSQTLCELAAGVSPQHVVSSSVRRAAVWLERALRVFQQQGIVVLITTIVTGGYCVNWRAVSDQGSLQRLQNEHPPGAKVYSLLARKYARRCRRCIVDTGGVRNDSQPHTFTDVGAIANQLTIICIEQPSATTATGRERRVFGVSYF